MKKKIGYTLLNKKYFIIIISQIIIEILFITVSLFLLKFIRFYIYNIQSYTITKG